MTEVLAEDQLKTRTITTGIAVPGSDDPAYVPTLGFKVDQKAVLPKTPPPQLGADTREVLHSIGMSEDELTQLESGQIIAL